MALFGGLAAFWPLAARTRHRPAIDSESPAMTDDPPARNLGAVFDAHVKAEFVDKDVAATMATMTAEPYLTHVPTLTGGTGRAEVEALQVARDDDLVHPV